MTPTERILSALADRNCDPKRNGKGWSARCPAHEDRRPSLSVSEGDDGRALVRCHAGCTVDAICDAVGLRVADLMTDDPSTVSTSTEIPKSQGNGPYRRRRQPRTYKTANAAVAALTRKHGKRSALWTYHDAQGDPVGVIVRWDTTKGKIIRPVSQQCGEWVIGGMPDPRPLYSLPSLAEADRVYVGEGEKAAAAAQTIGLTATTSAHGSQSPSKTDWSPLAGKECVILPDNDEAGRKYAETVAAILAKLTPRPVVKIVELPELPDHGDIVDWIDAHGDAAEPEEMRRKVEALADAAEPTQSEKWPDVRPLPDDLSPVLPYEADMLPTSIGSFVSDVSERLQCPPDFTAVATVVVLGIAIGRRCAIRPKRQDDWSVVANIWGGVVGPPSVLKTPAIMAAVSLLQRLEVKAKKQYQADLRKYESQKQLVNLKKKEAARAAASALKEGDEAQALAELDVEEPKPPVRRRYITNDATVEKLGELLADNPLGVLGFRDELSGFLASLEKENQQTARSFYLEAWNGTGRFTYDRIGRGTLDIESAVVSLFGGIQPGRLRPYVRSTVEGGAGDDGLIQRFQLLVWPDVSKQWRNVDRWPDSAAKARVFEIVERLTEFDAKSAGAEVDKFDSTQTPFLRFNESAQQEFDLWREGLERRLRSGEEHPAIESHLGKYRSLVPSLALIFHLVEHECGPVELSSLTLAIRWSKYLESHARRIYSAATAAELATAKAIWKRVECGDLADGFNARDIYRRGWTGLDDVESAKTGLELLSDHGYLVEQSEEQKRQFGRPPLPRYLANPYAKTPPKPTDKSDETNSVSSVSPFSEHSENDDDDWGDL